MQVQANQLKSSENQFSHNFRRDKSQLIRLNLLNFESKIW